jgi:hypothetical protein
MTPPATHQIPSGKYFMKKTNQLSWAHCLWPISMAIAVLCSGCATSNEHSFNQDYNDNLSVNPKYRIHDEDGNKFLITVDQGSPSKEADRVSDVKVAATTVAKTECQRLGWQRWDLNYIQERDQGWMHVVIAEVKRE